MTWPGRSAPPGSAVRRFRLALDRWRRALFRNGRYALRAAWLALRRLVDSDDLTFASSIAYYALLSLFPLLLLLFSLLGRVATDPASREAVVGFLLRYFPERVDFITAQLGEVRSARLGLGLAGTAVIVWTALAVFRAVSSAVDHAWNVERRRSFLRHQASAFMMLVAAGAVMAAALVFASVGEVMSAGWFGELIETVPGVARLGELALRYPATLLLIAVVALIQYFVPNTAVRFADIWPGAVLTGVLWRVALDAFSWYLGLGAVTVHGSIAAIVVFLLWVYVSSVILLYGVEFSAAYARLRQE